jgi:ubiquinone/menaquinone biosynthesis C-methylase UbiE
MQHKPKDLFSSDNGGKSYEKFRPEYPQEFIDQISSFSQGKKNFLDIACGTGQILFALYKCFEEHCVGVDLSQTQLDVAKQKLDALRNSGREDVKPQFELVTVDAYKIAGELKKKGINSKFDLITIGEALHWFDTEELLTHIKINLLETGGKFCVLNYNTPFVEFNVEDEEFKKVAQNHFNKFFSIIRNSFEYNLDSFFSGYEDIPFEKYFTQVKATTLTKKVACPIDAFVGYYKTYSGYSTYLKNHKQDPQFEDPAEELSTNLKKDLEAYCKNNNIEMNDEQVIMTNVFYLKELSD